MDSKGLLSPIRDSWKGFEEDLRAQRAPQPLVPAEVFFNNVFIWRKT